MDLKFKSYGSSNSKKLEGKDLLDDMKKSPFKYQERLPGMIISLGESMLKKTPSIKKQLIKMKIHGNREFKAIKGRKGKKKKSKIAESEDEDDFKNSQEGSESEEEDNESNSEEDNDKEDSEDKNEAAAADSGSELDNIDIDGPEQVEYDKNKSL